MKKIVVVILALLFTNESFGWGLTGHRVVGLIAERHLNKKARKQIEEILKNESIAEVSNYMDFIKSDATFRKMSPWHYATIPNGKKYEEVGTPEEGDIIQTIQRLIDELKAKEFSDMDEAFALKCLIHLVGDIHQPLHVGNGEDKGGNDVSLQYFGTKTNLHSVWDQKMIDGQQYSYVEYANWIDHVTKVQEELWSSTSVMDWAYESMQLRNQCYETIPSNYKLSYQYVYDNIELVNQRLLQAGIRLASLLNEIYG